MERSKRREIPVSMFGIVLGLAGIGNAWRVAERIWPLPPDISEVILAAAGMVWLALVTLYARKWLLARDEALVEARHPIQCCFVGLTGVATMLVAVAGLRYSRPLAVALFALGALVTLGFALWRTGVLWRGGREPTATTPILYLPTVAGSFVMANGAAALGFAEWGQYVFGVGLFGWVAIESVLLHRLYTAPEMPPALRPSLGIQLAPPAVGAVAYLNITGGHADAFARALVGYGLLQALLILRLLPWILQQPFNASYWAFSFGASALAIAPLTMVEHGDAGAAAVLAPYVFVLANLVIGLLVLATLNRLLLGQLLPKSEPALR